MANPTPTLTSFITIDHLRAIDFWRRVAVDIDVWTERGYCWSIERQLTDDYPVIYVPRRVSGLGRPIGLKGHRVAKMLDLGRVLQSEEEVDHLCYHPFCVKPNHLEVVTRLENVRRIRTPRQILRGW